VTSNVIDLDQQAGRREATEPEGIPVKFRGQTFLLPSELPVDAFDPLLDDDLGLLDIVRDIAGSEKGITGSLLDVLLTPGTIKRARKAVEAVFEQLFGPDQYAAFRALRPSIPDYIRIVQGLRRLYGVSLGEAFASLTSSESSGATPKQTSPDSTSSTPAASGAAPDSAPGSSASDA
jgi:hypothetical protein